MNIDLEKPVAVTREIFWVGYYDKFAERHCNTYILLDNQEAILFDPGSIPYFPIIMGKIMELVEPKKISTIIVTHQDPDACGNLPVVEDVIERDNLKIITHSKTIHFLQHYGIRSNIDACDKHNNRLTLASGRTLTFHPIPHLPSCGAITVLDEQSHSLFSGNLFGAFHQNWSLFAQADYPQPMIAFHRMLISGNQALRQGIQSLEKLTLDRILPQHGSVIEKPWIDPMMAHLKSLKCGLDLNGVTHVG